MLTRSFMDPKSSEKLLAYTPMFHARLFNETKRFRDQHFQPTWANAVNAPEPKDERAAGAAYLDGRHDVDRPLTVQFCANDPDELLEAARYVQQHCDAVDLNLGCPQRIARSGNYGAFLQEHQELIYRLIHKLHQGLDVPVTAKIRILETKEATLDYARNVLSAGASILTVHGRRREQKGHNTGLADWSMIRYLRENLPSETVLFANGNILRHGDIARCLEATGADGVMSAEGNLNDPTIFAPPPASGVRGEGYWRSPLTGKGGYRMDYVFRRYMSIIYQYILEQPGPQRESLFDPSQPISPEPKIHNPHADEADGPPKKKQKKHTKTAQVSPSLAGMQAHLFNMLRPLVAANTNVRDALARARGTNMSSFEYVLALTEQAVRRGLLDYAENPTKYETDISSEGDDNADIADLADPESSAKAIRACRMPWWVCQPYIRPLPKEAYEKGSLQMSKKQKKQMQTEESTKTLDGSVKQSQVSVSGAADAEMNDTRKRSLESIEQHKAEEKAQASSEIPAAAEICG